MILLEDYQDVPYLEEFVFSEVINFSDLLSIYFQFIFFNKTKSMKLKC